MPALVKSIHARVRPSAYGGQVAPEVDKRRYANCTGSHPPGAVGPKGQCHENDTLMGVARADPQNQIDGAPELQQVCQTCARNGPQAASCAGFVEGLPRCIRPVSRCRGMRRSSDRERACGRRSLPSPASHRRNHSPATVAPAVLVHERFVDKSTPKRCVYHPRVVHSWVQDQAWTRWPLDLRHFQRAGLIVPGAMEKRDGPRRFTR